MNNLKPISPQLVKYKKTSCYFLHPFIGILHLMESKIVINNTGFEDVVDEYSSVKGGYIEDEEISPTIESDDGFEGDLSLDEEDSEEVKPPDKTEEIQNHDLRLLNDYFKEIGSLPLLTPKEEVEVAAKIKRCEIRAKEIKRVIEVISAKRFVGDIRSTVGGLK